MEDADSSLVSAWLRYEAEEHTKGEDSDWWAVEELQGIFRDEPDRAWNITVQLAEAAETPWQLVMIGCGVLEDLLNLDPDRYLDRLDVQGRTNRKLIAAAANVWASGPMETRLDDLLAKYGQPRV
jgi:hypothetical protein